MGLQRRQCGDGSKDEREERCPVRALPGGH
jgi:hypothetical protein